MVSDLFEKLYSLGKHILVSSKCVFHKRDLVKLKVILFVEENYNQNVNIRIENTKSVKIYIDIHVHIVT